MKKKLMSFVSVIILGSMLYGCTKADTKVEVPAVTSETKTEATAEAPKAETPKQKVTIKIAGSTSVAPLMKEIKTAYEGENSNITLEIQESGSSAGITATIEGAANIGMSSRDLKDAEKEKGLKDTVIAVDGIAVILNKENPVADLTKDQITAIYKGEIKNWSEVGGNDGKIIVVSREEGSGTRGAYEELMELTEEIEKDGKKLVMSKISEDAYFENSTGAVKTNVSSSKNAIGYISFGALDDTVKEINVGSVTCNEENIKNKTYPIARPFIVCTLGEATGDSKVFLDYILSDAGQKIVSEHNYVSVK